MLEPLTPLIPAPPEAPDEVAFEARVSRPPQPGRFVRSGIVLGSALLFVVGAMAAMGASSASPAAPGAGTAAAAATDPDTTTDNDLGRGGFGGGRGGFGHGGVTITAISGSSLSLETVDGWTRTITASDTTTVTRAGVTIAVGDLKVGDQIAFRQELATDGTYTITAIALVLPSIGGEVTAIDGSTITVTRFDGTTGTIHVDDATTYRTGDDETAALSDITVGSFIVAAGTERDDGSLDAETVRSGRFGRGGGHGFPGGLGWPGDKDSDPTASPDPSTTPG